MIYNLFRKEHDYASEVTKLEVVYEGVYQIGLMAKELIQPYLKATCLIPKKLIGSCSVIANAYLTVMSQDPILNKSEEIKSLEQKVNKEN